MLTIGYIGNGKSTNRYHLPFSLNRDHLKVKTTIAVMEILEKGMEECN